MEDSSNILKYKITGASGFAIVLLVLVLVGLGERVLYDLSRIFVGPDFDYFNDLSTLLVHTLFAMVLIVVAVIINLVIAEKKQKYAIVFIPYFVMAVTLTLQVAFEAAIYFYGHHTQLQFYLVMSILVFISSMLIYFIQKSYVPKELTVGSGSSVLQRAGMIVLFLILGLIAFSYIGFFLR